MESVTIKSEPTGSETPKQDQVAARPDYIPEKFWDVEKGTPNVEALAKSYSELEKGKSGKTDAAPTDSNQDTKKDGDIKFSVPGVEAESLTKFSKEIEASGQLSENSYAELTKAGYSKAMVDAYITGLKHSPEAVAQKEATEALTNEIYAAIGGQEKYAEMTAWVSANASKEDIDQYNSVMDSRNPAMIRLAVADMKSKYIAAVGQPPENLIQGDASTGSVAPFKSSHEVTQAMKSPEYKKDPAFRERVKARLAVSNVF